jgi:phosphoglucomutase
MYDVLLDIYMEYGYYRETLISIVKKGKDGLALIQQMMAGFRDNPPQNIDGSKVVCIHDYLKSMSVDLITGQRTPIHMQQSNVLQFTTHDGTIVSVRPSGTEPKIKFYFGMRADLNDRAQFDEVTAKLQAKFERIKQELRIE